MKKAVQQQLMLKKFEQKVSKYKQYYFLLITQSYILESSKLISEVRWLNYSLLYVNQTFKMSGEETARVSRILSEVVSRGLINDVTPSVETFDFDYFSERISDLKKAFPEQFVLHALAVKGNPLRGILQVRCSSEKHFVFTVWYDDLWDFWLHHPNDINNQLVFSNV